MFFDQLMFTCQYGGFLPPPSAQPESIPAVYQPVCSRVEKCSGKRVVLVTCCREEDQSLLHMIQDFRAVLPYESQVVNLWDVPFQGGCLGCLHCAATGTCIYSDGFDQFLRREIQTADAIVNHYTYSVFKCYDDRQFCNGHRTVTRGTPVAYLLQGNYRYEANLQMVLEGRSEVGGNYLCGVVRSQKTTTSPARVCGTSSSGPRKPWRISRKKPALSSGITVPGPPRLSCARCVTRYKPGDRLWATTPCWKISANSFAAPLTTWRGSEF